MGEFHLPGGRGWEWYFLMRAFRLRGVLGMGEVFSDEGGSSGGRLGMGGEIVRAGGTVHIRCLG